MKTYLILPTLFGLYSILSSCKPNATAKEKATTEQVKECIPGLWKYVATEMYDPRAHGVHRLHSLITVAVCCSIKGVVKPDSGTVGYSSDDGDYNFTVRLDPGMEKVLNDLIDANERAAEAIRYYTGSTCPCYPPKVEPNQRIKCEIICEDKGEYGDDPLLVERCDSCPVVQRGKMIKDNNHLEIGGRLVWDESHFEIHPVSWITQL